MLTITLQKGGAKLPRELWDEWQRGANDFRVRAEYMGRAFTFDYWDDEEPTADELVESLRSGCIVGASSLEDFEQSDEGKEIGSEAGALWRSCRTIAREVKRVMGDAFSAFVS